LTTYLEQGNWRFTLATNADEASTAAAIVQKITDSGNNTYNFNIADIKWRTNFMIGYRF
jgi:hypothetical protein